MKHFTTGELLPLLHHPNAVVRAYVVRHVVAQLPAHSESLLPLLADAKTVPVLPAETTSGFVIDLFVADQLCKHAGVPAIKGALRRAADRSDVRASIRNQIHSYSMDPPPDDLPLDIQPSGAAKTQQQP